MFKTRLLLPKLFYFCWFTATGSLTFNVLYYRSIGLDLAQIGMLAAISGTAQIFAAPLWAMLADTFRLRRVLLPMVVFMTIPLVLLIGVVQNFALLACLVLGLAVFTAPVSPLADTSTMMLLGNDRTRYGSQRMWGSIGWAASTAVFGTLTDRYGLRVIFPGYAALACVTGCVALALPRTEALLVGISSSARTLIRDGRWRWFLGCVFLVGCCSSVINNFLQLYLQDRGASGGQVGLALTISSTSEMLLMACSPLILRRWGTRPLMVMGGVVFGLRMLLYIFAPSAEWALAVQVLHGLSFGAFWTAAVVEAQRLAPRGLEATSQSLLGISMSGVAASLSSLAGGRIYRDYGSASLFGLVGAMALLGGLGMLRAERPLARAGEEVG